MPDDPSVLACAATFISDIGMVRGARIPGTEHRPLSGASLDHALWLHRPFSGTEWLLFSTRPASNFAARGLAQGALQTEDGTLVATISQEAILRPAGTFALGKPPAVAASHPNPG